MPDNDELENLKMILRHFHRTITTLNALSDGFSKKELEATIEFMAWEFHKFEDHFLD